MANTAYGKAGLRPFNHLGSSGLFARANTTYLLTAGEDIAPGDPIQLLDAGTSIECSDAAGGQEDAIGVADNYVSATATDRRVYWIPFLPGQEWLAQAGATTGITADDLGKSADWVIGTQATKTGLYGTTEGYSATLLGETWGATGNVTAVRLADGEAFGANAMVVVTPNEVQFYGAGVGIADA